MPGRAVAGLVVGVVLLFPGPPVSVAQPAAGGGEMTVDELVDQALRQNVELAAVRAEVDAAVGRLRPKVMTVTTVVVSLLPIMWSHSTGAEVMKPLAAPVLGGMVSSLAHVLIVTPVIFYWLRERRLSPEEGGGAGAPVSQ